VAVAIGVFVGVTGVLVDVGADVFVAPEEVLVAVVEPDTVITTDMEFPKYCPLSFCILHQPV
jgi:hypothetical protein